MPEDAQAISDTQDAIYVSDIQPSSAGDAPRAAGERRSGRTSESRGEERQEARGRSGPSATEVPVKRSERTAARREETGADAADDPALDDGIAAEDAAIPPGRRPQLVRDRARGLGQGTRQSPSRGPKTPGPRGL
ncbi:hypothetical protein AB0L70_04730 [Kribbella sp. NPDC051952]|uniref:hypothetical protein n=1 Tax=Kribbella sp. NPDC051952 TaxID=3154851 RepID=UPI003439A53F